MRVPAFLTDQSVAFETIVHAPAFTSQRRAKVLHVPGRLLAKSVLLNGPGGFFVAVLPATHAVCTDVLAAEMGGPVRLATDREVADLFRDCEWGVLNPFGTLYGISTVIDDGLDPEAFMVFESHTHAVTIRMRCKDYMRLERPRRLSFARHNP